MKKLTIILLLLLIVVGCKDKNVNNKKKKKVIEEKKEIVEEVQESKKVEKEEIPIAFYNGNNKLTNFKTNIVSGKDIGIFSMYLSDDDNINNDVVSLYNKYLEYKKTRNIKIGYNLTYSIQDGRTISHNILSVNDTEDYQGYILVFLYDDYNNRGKSFYSHIEQGQENENTLVSSIKLYPQSASNEIVSKIILTVFVYEGEDDFDQNNEYIGNSKYSIEICDINKTC